MSKIEITVDWERPTVFAGEEVSCIITFTNTSQPPASPIQPAFAQQSRSGTSARERWKADLPTQSSPASATFSKTAEKGTDGRRPAHRPTLSLNVPVNPTRTTATGPDSAASGENKPDSAKHKRSVSIISLGQQSAASEDRESGSIVSPVQHIKNSHAKNSSFQGLPIRKSSLPVSPQLSSPSILQQPSTASRSPPNPPLLTESPIGSPVRHGSSRKASGARATQHEPPRLQGFSQSLLSDAPKRDESPATDPGAQTGSQNHSLKANGLGITRSHSQREKRASAASASSELVNRSLKRVSSPSNIEGASRSSMDIYSNSNGSSETLQSEYVQPNNTARPPMHKRQGSSLALSGKVEPQTLMMGYVQLVGSFILEGSLVNLAPFEAVKRRGVIGGQGSGGVVGIEAGRREAGLFGSLGWSSIGQSIGGLLGSEEPSSIREMKGIANSKSVPIISTAQSILFVDLRLKPGESRRFRYTHALPHGIPPSFKGRAIKSSYNLVVGTQRPQSTRPQFSRVQHSVRQIEVPFKVQPSINTSGELLSHDLMEPHVILKDMSKTETLDSVEEKDLRGHRRTRSTAPQDEIGFKEYVRLLLEGQRKDSDAGLLSPTASIPNYGPSVPDAKGQQYPQISTKHLIDMAIAQQSMSGTSRIGSTSLQISRHGEKVAKVLLSRTGFRVGETVVGSVDFTNGTVPCFALNASLESSEVVDPSIALRSEASIHRATRRIHAQTSENTICTQRVNFALPIPPSATPDFVTSGVRLEWKLRLEFVTEDVEPGDRARGLLDVNDEDERGVFMSATPSLPSQTLEVPIALRVYGTTAEVEESPDTKGYKV